MPSLKSCLGEITYTLHKLIKFKLYNCLIFVFLNIFNFFDKLKSPFKITQYIMVVLISFFFSFFPATIRDPKFKKTVKLNFKMAINLIFILITLNSIKTYLYL